MGTLLDALHVFNGVAYYSNWRLIPVLKVATYVPGEFALAGVVVGMLRPELDEELDRPGSRIGLGRVIAGMLALVVVWGGSGVLMRLGLSNAAICGILTPLAGLIWFALDPTRQAAVAAILTAVIGVIVESILVVTGTYDYTRPDLFGLVPVWLPSLYLTACIAIGNLGWYLKYSWVKPRRKQG
ncbi:MAG: hypothetical protein R3F14_30580 [Polyangiaceae bacterium]